MCLVDRRPVRTPHQAPEVAMVPSPRAVIQKHPPYHSLRLGLRRAVLIIRQQSVGACLRSAAFKSEQEDSPGVLKAHVAEGGSDFSRGVREGISSFDFYSWRLLLGMLLPRERRWRAADRWRCPRRHIRRAGALGFRLIFAATSAKSIAEINTTAIPGTCELLVLSAHVVAALADGMATEATRTRATGSTGGGVISCLIFLLGG